MTQQPNLMDSFLSKELLLAIQTKYQECFYLELYTVYNARLRSCERHERSFYDCVVEVMGMFYYMSGVFSYTTAVLDNLTITNKSQNVSFFA